MIRTTRWSPDTCGCVLEYEWDDSQPPQSRTHTYSAMIKRCSAHSGLAGAALWVSVEDENRRKNRVLSLAQTILPTIIEENYLWWFDNNRVLNINLVGVSLTPGQRTALQTLLQTTFGANKARLT